MREYDLIIFDADGTLRRCTVDGQPCPNAAGQWELMPNVKETMAKFDYGPDGILIGIASNQAGVSLGYLTEHAAYQLLKDLFVEVTGRWPIQGLLQVCPHPVNGGCACRKPEPGMLLKIMQVAGVPSNHTFYVGDMDSDEQAARNAGVDFQWAKDFFGWVESSPLSPEKHAVIRKACDRDDEEWERIVKQQGGAESL